MDLSNGITQEFTVITETLVKSTRVINRAILDEAHSRITITEMGDSSEPTEIRVDIDIYPTCLNIWSEQEQQKIPFLFR